MKNLLLLCVLLASVSSFAQLHFPVLNNDINTKLVQVIEEYPNHFNGIRGDVIDKNIQSVIYASTVNIHGADSSIIIQNGELTDNIYSWKEVVFNTDNFDAAKAKFHEYYRKIKGTSVSIGDDKINFNADFDEPDNSKPFTTILFNAHPDTQELKNVVIDLSLQYKMDSWEIAISVYEHIDYGVNASN